MPLDIGVFALKNFLCAWRLNTQENIGYIKGIKQVLRVYKPHEDMISEIKRQKYQ